MKRVWSAAAAVAALIASRASIKRAAMAAGFCVGVAAAAMAGTQGHPDYVAPAQKPTYRFATGPITSFAASATDGLVIGGSATKTVKVLKLSICGTATSATAIDVLLIKRSAADSSGTPVAATGVPVDATDAAVTATVNTYTANPTVGAAVGNVDARKLNLGTAAGGAGCLYWTFGEANDRPIVLRGTAQQLAVGYNGVTLPSGASISYMAEVTEE